MLRIGQVPIADLHCHYPMHLLAEEERRYKRDPALKSLIRLKERKRWDRLKATILFLAARLFNTRRLWESWRVSLERLEQGNVNVVFSVLFLPDEEMDLDEWPEGNPDDGAYARLVSHLEQVESDLGIGGSNPKAVIVKSEADLEPGSANDALPRFAHCVEGGFHLGAKAELFEERIGELSKRGVAYITLAHLFWRQVATNAPALPFLSDSRYQWLFPQPKDVGLNELGRAAVRAMYKHRVLIDVSHMSQAAIDDTFELLDELDDEHGTRPEEFPVIATHAGYRFGNQSYMLSAATIEQIAARDGVIGLILAHHQLNDGLFARRGELKRTLAALNAHIDAIHGITGSHRHVGIGSDLDGFIKPTVGGIEYANDLKDLEVPLHDTYSEAAKLILRENAVRALRSTLDEPAY